MVPVTMSERLRRSLLREDAVNGAWREYTSVECVVRLCIATGPCTITA